MTEIVEALKKAISGGDKLDMNQITKMLERVTMNENTDTGVEGYVFSIYLG